MSDIENEIDNLSVYIPDGFTISLKNPKAILGMFQR